MIDELLADARHKLDGAIEHLKGEFATVRTGRANPAILHRVMVPYYGMPTPLQKLATFSVPEPHQLVVHPFDPQSLHDIEKAIQVSDLGINPSNDGTAVRLTFPPLTEERRRDLVKLVHHMAEEARVAARNIRRHTMEDLEALEGEMSEDEIRRGQKELQHHTDQANSRIAELVKHKESEMMEV